MYFKKIIIPLLSTFCLMSSFITSTYAEMTEKQTTLNDQISVAVTIYNKDLALIKDQRSVSLDKGLNYLAFRGVSAHMRSETAMLRSLSHNKGFEVIEQNFDYDLLTPTKLLEKYLGKEVTLVTTNPATGKQSKEQAIILSTHQGVVVKIGDRIETNPKGSFIFADIPSNLRDQPTLLTQLYNPVSQPQQLELSYLTKGLSWKADYIVELNANDDQIDLLGWVTLKNQSGTDYNNSKLQLVAGDVNQVKKEIHPQLDTRSLSMTAKNVTSMQEESLFEYHLYSLSRLTTLLNNQTKQVSLLSADAIPVNKEFILHGEDYYYNSSFSEIGNKLKISVFIQFENKKNTGLGMPIPKGTVRVYKKDQTGNAQFIGEDSIDHTPKNEKIRLKLGNAFDITANKKQTDFIKRNSILPGRQAYESAFQIELKNAKTTPVTVTVHEPIPGDWKIISESHSHIKLTAGMAEWQITIPAESSQILEYRVLIQF